MQPREEFEQSLAVENENSLMIRILAGVTGEAREVRLPKELNKHMRDFRKAVLNTLREFKDPMAIRAHDRVYDLDPKNTFGELAELIKEGDQLMFDLNWNIDVLERAISEETGWQLRNQLSSLQSAKGKLENTAIELVEECITRLPKIAEILKKGGLSICDLIGDGRQNVRIDTLSEMKKQNLSQSLRDALTVFVRDFDLAVVDTALVLLLFKQWFGNSVAEGLPIPLKIIISLLWFLTVIDPIQIGIGFYAIGRYEYSPECVRAGDVVFETRGKIKEVLDEVLESGDPMGSKAVMYLLSLVRKLKECRNVEELEALGQGINEETDRILPQFSKLAEPA
jgi:hypothetical protein